MWRGSPALCPAPVSHDDDTLLFLELGWGARGSSHDWTGEITLEGGAITGLEPMRSSLEEVFLVAVEGAAEGGAL